VFFKESLLAATFVQQTRLASGLWAHLETNNQHQMMESPKEIMQNYMLWMWTTDDALFTNRGMYPPKKIGISMNR